MFKTLNEKMHFGKADLYSTLCQWKYVNICDGPRSDKQLSSERKYVGIMYSYAYIICF